MIKLKPQKSPMLCGRIIQLSKIGKSQREIVAELRKEKIFVAQSTVSYILKKQKDTGNVQRKKAVDGLEKQRTVKIVF